MGAGGGTCVTLTPGAPDDISEARWNVLCTHTYTNMPTHLHTDIYIHNHCHLVPSHQVQFTLLHAQACTRRMSLDRTNADGTTFCISKKRYHVFVTIEKLGACYSTYLPGLHIPTLHYLSFPCLWSHRSHQKKKPCNISLTGIRPKDLCALCV